MPKGEPRSRVIRPQAGFQEKYLSTPADIAIGGGAAGAGKTFALLLEAARNVGVRGYGATIFRRTYPQVTNEGGLWDESMALYPHLGGTPLVGDLSWRFPSGASISFGHLQHEKSVLDYQGAQIAFIGFDELTHFSESQFFYLMSRNRSTCGVPPYIRATCNPDPDSFVRRLIDWWIGPDGFVLRERSGVLRWFIRVQGEIVWGDSRDELAKKHPGSLPLSLTFIEGKLDDNKILQKIDPGYQARLEGLPRVERERLLKRNWNVRDAAGNVFRRSDFSVVRAVPGRMVDTVRAWDRAASEPTQENPEPAWTAGVKMARLEDGRYVVLHVERMRKRAGEVERRIVRLAGQDGSNVRVAMFQDPGGAGKGEIEQAVRALAGFSVETRRASADKVTFAKPYAAQAEHGNVLLLDGPWVEDFLSEHEAFPDAPIKDQVDAAALAFMSLSVPELVYL